MKISGFSILNNAVRFAYPFQESLRSLLPLVDELVVGVGDAPDGTWQALHAMREPKIKAFRSRWDPRQRQAGLILSQQTNLALARCSGDWAVYLQADEVLHEDDLQRLRQSMHAHRQDKVEGLTFDYLHFYGSYQTTQTHWRKWYRHAVRAIKLGKHVQSVGDAYGFKIKQAGGVRDLKEANSDARVFHYGWCRPPLAMRAKQRNLDSFYHDDAWLARQASLADPKVAAFYADRGYLAYFQGSHPQVMRERIAAQNWRFDHGIERQAPAWIRWLDVAFLYPLKKRWSRWRAA